MKMRKFTYLLLPIVFFCSVQNSIAQLYVSNNYVYVADKYLYVKQDVNIQGTGGVFLRNQ